MKLRHAVALLAIVTSIASCQHHASFWLLMMPPVGKNGSPNLNAPLKEWTSVGHLYSSDSDCERMRKASTDFAANEKQFFTNTFKDFGDKRFAQVKALASLSVCISSDDSRLVF